MNWIKIFSFNSAAYARLNRINKKREIRRQRIKEAYSYLNEWNDIPISQLFGSVCDILKIKRNEAAKNLIFRMNMDYTIEQVEKLIPLSELPEPPKI